MNRRWAFFNSRAIRVFVDVSAVHVVDGVADLFAFLLLGQVNWRARLTGVASEEVNRGLDASREVDLCIPDCTPGQSIGCEVESFGALGVTVLDGIPEFDAQAWINRVDPRDSALRTDLERGIQQVVKCCQYLEVVTDGRQHIR